MEALIKHFIDVVIDGVKQFGVEIVAACLLVGALRMFPVLKEIFKEKDPSEKELTRKIENVTPKIDKLTDVMSETLQHLTKSNSDEELHKQLDEQRAEEAKVKAELQREEKRKEEERLKAESERKKKELEEQKRKVPKISKAQKISQLTARQLYELGKKYYDDGYTFHKYKAFNYFSQAAEQGYVEAQYWLGTMYKCGTGVGQNYSEARKWYRKAAEQGHVEAQYWLGEMYKYGVGVKRNTSEARKWYEKAAAQGYKPAQEALKHL